MQRRIVGTARGLVVLLVLVLLLIGLETPARAQPAAGPDWEPTGTTQATWKLFAPASGALFAMTGHRDISDHLSYLVLTGLLRSDDAGASWRPIDIPSGPQAIAVDPTDHRVLYVAALGKLHRSDDDGLSWRAVAPAPAGTGAFLMVSAADPRVVYAGYGGSWSGPSGPARPTEFFVTTDRGDNWESRSLTTEAAGACGWGYLRPFDFLVPDSADPARLFMAGGCSGGGTLLVSPDRGEHWQKLFEAPRQQVYLASSGGLLAPDRLYVATHTRGTVASPSTFSCCAVTRLHRSDDGGQTWTERQSWTNQGTEGGTNVFTYKGKEYGAVTFDVSAPDRVYVGLTFGGGGVQASEDGGDTWTVLGRRDLGEIHDLALGIDGTYLFAATDDGVFRLRVR